MEVSLISPKLISRFERYSKRVRQGTVNYNLWHSTTGKSTGCCQFFFLKNLTGRLGRSFLHALVLGARFTRY